tara:strand:+ start:86 stop:256 length:171 start_codon:yes stop_codon:yes gene_type:complete
MTKDEIKNIKNAWAQSEGYTCYDELVKHHELNGYTSESITESLLAFSYKNSHKYAK